MSNSVDPSTSPTTAEAPGAKYVGVIGIWFLGAYVVILIIVALCSLVILWPTPIPAGSQNEGEPSPIQILFWTFSIYYEVRLLLIVTFAGALGTLVHGVRSLYWYIGNRELVRSWIAMYLLQPLAAAGLAVVFYLVIRGGFFSPQAGFKQTSPFGFAAMGALVGMFSDQAVLKLKQIAETVFQKPQPGENAKPQEGEQV